MVTQNSLPLTQYEGTAIVNGTVYRVSVLVKGDRWKSDVLKAVNKAGGYDVSLDEGKELPPSVRYRMANILDASRICYEVTFSPDCCLTQGALNKKPITVLMRSDLSIIYDGELQKGYSTAKSNIIAPVPGIRVPRQGQRTRWP